MNLAGFAMRFRPVVITFVTLLAVWGAITFQTMPRREDPEFTIRSCVVSTRWPGAPAVKVEELITDKIEEALDSIEEVDTLRSTTINGLSTIYVDVEDRVTAESIANVWDKVRAKVELVDLPSRDIRPVVNDDFGDTSILLLGVFQVPLEGESEVNPDYRYTPRDLEDYADQVRDVLRLLPGVAKVEKFGVQDEAIFIETDLGTWSKVALTTSDLRQLVEARNIVLPGGTIDTDAGKFSVKPGGEFDAVSEIRSLPVTASESNNSVNLVTLSDIGLEVNRDYKQPSEVLCNFTDERGTFPAIMIGVTMKSGSNIIDVCERSLERVRELVEIDQSLPRDIAVKPVSNQADNVSMKISDVISNVVSAVVIVVIVVLLFVGLRTSLVMAANIPIVVMSSIAVIAVFGVELEQISLASIIIALGLLVDNAVQVCDQTRTNLLAGMKPTEAAVEGAKVLALPMLTGTLTTVAAFFPMLFALEGGGKEYVYSLPVTLSTTLLLSWLLAMTVCVILAAMFIRPPKDPDRPSAPLPWLGAQIAAMRSRATKESKKQPSDATTSSSNQNLFLRIYGWTAIAAIKAKWVTLAVSIGLLIVCMSLPVSSEFFPQDRRDQFFVNVILPETATIEQTREVVEQIESTVRALSPSVDEQGNEIERLRSMRSMMGKGGARWALGVDPPSPNSNVAEILVRTQDGGLTPQYINDLRRVTSEGDAELGIEPVVGARVIPKKLALGPPAAPLVLRVAGDGFADIDELRRIARDVKDLVQDQPETWDVNDSWGIDGFEIALEIDENKANLAQVTNANVADTLNAYFSGLQLSTFREGEKQIPVYFRLKADERNLAGIGAAFVEGQNGKIPLNSIAKPVQKWQPAKIERRDLNRTIEVRSEVEDGVSGNDIVLRVWNSERMKEIQETLPTGYWIEIGGSYEESQESSAQMLTSFGVSFLLIIIILVVQYNGWSKTLVILATLPMAMMGAFFGLWVTDSALGFMPQLGLLSLFGIVLNTGIIFIEFADILIARRSREEHGDGPINGLTRAQFHECLAEAGKQRMLPIFLTTATTVGGLLPLAMSGGPLWEGMAWLMIFGLLVATVLTLYVVPALYAIIVETFRVQPVGEQQARSA
ncbi:MAG: efflux RND transporter permease subunit [Aureliella sp.]